MSSTPFRTSLLVAIALALSALATASAATPVKNGPIAFRRYFDAQNSWGAVFTTDLSGTKERQITHPPHGVVDDQPEWAPDGSLLTFTRCAPGTACAVYVVRPDGSQVTRLSAECPSNPCVDDSFASFSPDSAKLAFTQGDGAIKDDPLVEHIIEHSAIALMNRDGTGRQTVFAAEPFGGDLMFPVFSPDGTKIVFERANSSFSQPAGKKAVFVVGLDGSNPQRLTPWSLDAGDNPDWSPNGRWIIYRTYNDDSGKQSQIFLVHPDGTGRKQITHFKPGTTVLSSSFSPDGRWIAFAEATPPANPDLYVMRTDGTGVRRVTHSKLWDSAPDWGPR